MPSPASFTFSSCCEDSTLGTRLWDIKEPQGIHANLTVLSLSPFHLRFYKSPSKTLAKFGAQLELLELQDTRPYSPHLLAFTSVIGCV